MTRVKQNWELFFAVFFLVLGAVAWLVKDNLSLMLLATFFTGLFAGKMLYAKDEIKYADQYGYMSSEELRGQ